jgi:DNA processing protein
LFGKHHMIKVKIITRDVVEYSSAVDAEYLVISQVPIIRYSQQGSKGNWCFFPERNVTLSALTKATVIVEAGNMSGTLIQARHAIQQNRKLFILDSCFHNSELTWPAKYLERGAIRVSEFDEIRAHLSG